MGLTALEGDGANTLLEGHGTIQFKGGSLLYKAV